MTQCICVSVGMSIRICIFDCAAALRAASHCSVGFDAAAVVQACGQLSAVFA